MKKSFNILAVEDNKADFILLKKALMEIEDIELDIININNGEDAFLFLGKKEPFVEAFTPSIIILDLNLPGISGHEILEKIKTDPILKSIPIVIYSTSDDRKDIAKSYELHANSYITKTFNIEELFNKILNIGEYWFKTSQLPDASNLFFSKEDE